MSSEEEDQYSGESEEEMASSDDDDYAYDAGVDPVESTKKVPYAILRREDIQRRQREAMDTVTGILGIPAEEAARVLRKFKWDVNRSNEEWFADVDAVRSAVGIVDDAGGAPTSSSSPEKCLICFETYKASQMAAAGCGHLFCKDCWRGYISAAVGSGPAVLDLRCPLPDCQAYVPSGLVLEVEAPEEATKYEEFAVRSFVEDNKAMSWCTGADCDNAAECLMERSADDALDVVCLCGNTFCFNCKEEAHRPVRCETVRKWVTKNSAESENLNWILANTKPCPKCKRPIEKNQGCMHMTCSQCKHEFCWLCNGAWSDHGERTGGFYACNRYEAARTKGDYDDESRRRHNAKASLERYMHYFERFDAHAKAYDKARSEATRTEAEVLETLSDMTRTPTSQLRFIMDAWRQVIECRRMLKWTYAYGYYSFEDEAKDPSLARQRQFFEFQQGALESRLENLHEVAEMELKRLQEEHTNGSIPTEVFQDFRKRLISLTDITCSFFDKLVKRLEKGFADMDREYAGLPDTQQLGNDAAPSSSGAGPSRAVETNSANGARAGAVTRRAGKRTRGGSNAGSMTGGRIDDGDEEPDFWKCVHCTLNNRNLDAMECEMCGLPRED